MFAECRRHKYDQGVREEVGVYFEAREGVIQTRKQGGVSEAVLGRPRGKRGAGLGGSPRTRVPCDWRWRVRRRGQPGPAGSSWVCCSQIYFYSINMYCMPIMALC